MGSKLSSGAIIGLLFLIFLFKSIVEDYSGLPRYSSVKVLIAPIIIAESLVFPQHAYKEDSIRAAYLDHVRGDLN